MLTLQDKQKIVICNNNIKKRIIKKVEVNKNLNFF